MPEWNIQSRAHQCQNCATAFKDRQSYRTILLEHAQGLERRDLCERCWQEQGKLVQIDPHLISHWQGVYEAPPAHAPEAIQKDTAESLLRKLVERREERHAGASYILAVMLERKRILKVKSQLREGKKRIFVYEHGRTGDIFTIADPDLQLAQLETVQREVSALLEHGIPEELPVPVQTQLPVDPAPSEEPFNPPSEVTTIAPA